jgi:hypothetical protein
VAQRGDDAEPVHTERERGGPEDDQRKEGRHDGADYGTARSAPAIARA